MEPILWGRTPAISHNERDVAIQKSFSAGRNFLRTGIDGTDIGHHILDNGVFGSGRVAVINHNPGHVLVSRIELLSGHCEVVHVLVPLSSSRAGVYLSPTQPVFGGATLSLSHEVSCVVFQTKSKGQSLAVVVVILNGTGLNQVALTFLDTVLASVGPIRSVLHSAGVSVRDQVKLTDLPEISRVDSLLEGGGDEGETVRAQRLGVEVNLNFAVSGNSLEIVRRWLVMVGQEDDGGEDKSCNKCLLEHSKQIYDNAIKSYRYYVISMQYCLQLCALYPVSSNHLE